MADRPLNVLVVDDDKDVRDVIRQMFASTGCSVTPAGNSTEAINEFLTKRFDLITLDYRMPGLDGAALHRVLSQEFGAGKRTTGFAPKKLPPIAVITGHPEEPDVIRTQFGESVVCVLGKPVVLDDIRKLVKSVNDLAAKARADS
jgi:CheY-like chemotaxis protein